MRRVRQDHPDQGLVQGRQAGEEGRRAEEEGRDQEEAGRQEARRQEAGRQEVGAEEEGHRQEVGAEEEAGRQEGRDQEEAGQEVNRLPRLFGGLRQAQFVPAARLVMPTTPTNPTPTPSVILITTHFFRPPA